MVASEESETRLVRLGFRRAASIKSRQVALVAAVGAHEKSTCRIFERYRVVSQELLKLMGRNNGLLIHSG